MVLIITIILFEGVSPRLGTKCLIDKYLLLRYIEAKTLYLY
jgi:hypothetical protein